MKLIKCNECGHEFKSISSTHLKSKHNMTMSDYMKKYPNAELVANTIRGLRAQTLDNMIRRHGDEEGKRRWEIYRQKQAYTNSFEYKNKVHGMSEDSYTQYNKRRGKRNGNYNRGYLKVWIDKYGETVANEMNSEISPKKDSRSLNWFKSKYGDVDGKILYDEYCDKQAERSLELILNNCGKVIYNPSSIPIITEYGKRNGYNFKHAENGGEQKILRYYVDAYDEVNRTILEYYEQSHRYSSKRDAYRRDRILNECGNGWKFIELWYNGEEIIYEKN